MNRVFTAINFCFFILLIMFSVSVIRTWCYKYHHYSIRCPAELIVNIAALKRPYQSHCCGYIRSSRFNAAREYPTDRNSDIRGIRGRVMKKKKRCGSEQPEQIIPQENFDADGDAVFSDSKIATTPSKCGDSLVYTGSEPIRVNKWLAQKGVCSRREAEELITSGSISINGIQISSPGQKITHGQQLVIAQYAKQKLSDKLTVVLHKPVGFVSGTPEAAQIPAVRLLKQRNRFIDPDLSQLEGHDTNFMINAARKFAPIGRLDQDSRGLLIMSEDGVIAKRIISPESMIEKEYIVTVRGAPVTESILARLRNGLMLDGRRLKTAVVMPIEESVMRQKHGNATSLRFILKEGRKRQIRRMCDAVGLTVVDLLRVRVGPVELGNLPEGQWRMLTSKEEESLLSDDMKSHPT